jgi:hypothetical protein
MTNEISIEIDGKTITGSYEVKRGTITVSDRTGSKSAPLGGDATTELLARRLLLRELHTESQRPRSAC